MPVFTQQMRDVDFRDPQGALKEMYKHIKYIQEQLEYTLSNLDSTNVTEIDTDATNITSSSGGSSFSGDSITLSGANGEVFEAGVGSDRVFKFKVSGRGGSQILYLTSDGELVITKRATISIDGGEW